MSEPIFEKTYFASIKKEARAVACKIAGFDESLIVLKVTGQDSPNIQMDFAMSSDTYLLDFGEKLSPLTIAGIIPLSKSCASVASVKGQLNKLYKAHKLGKKPVKVQIGADTYSAYVTSKNTSVSSEQPEIVNFSMSFLGYRVGGGVGGGGAGGDTSAVSSGADQGTPASGVGSLSDAAFDLNSSGMGTTSVDDSISRSIGFISDETQGNINRAQDAYRRSINAGRWAGYAVPESRNKYAIDVQ